MSVWLKILRHSKDVIYKKRDDLKQEDIHVGRVYGTFYVKPEMKPSKGVLLIHGFAGNRHALGVLGQRLADAGFFALSIDIPSHYLNPNSKISFGELSEVITEAVLLMRSQFGVSGVGVIAHSTSALGALFSAVGYSVAVETYIYKLWEYIRATLASIPMIIAKFPMYDATPLFEKVEEAYARMEKVMMQSLQNGIAISKIITCYVLLAPPANFKSAFPGICLLRPLPARMRNRTFETALLHKYGEWKSRREGHDIPLVKEQDPNYAKWGAFKTRHLKGLLDYLASVKEPKDFIELMQDFASEKTGQPDEETNFFRYCQKLLENKPKLFIYGKFDIFLRPFLPGGRKRLEKFYLSCQNAEVWRGNFTHLMLERPLHHIAGIGITNLEVTERIMLFLDQHLRRFI